MTIKTNLKIATACGLVLTTVFMSACSNDKVTVEPAASNNTESAKSPEIAKPSVTNKAETVEIAKPVSEKSPVEIKNHEKFSESLVLPDLTSHPYAGSVVIELIPDAQDALGQKNSEKQVIRIKLPKREFMSPVVPHVANMRMELTRNSDNKNKVAKNLSGLIDKVDNFLMSPDAVDYLKTIHSELAKSENERVKEQAENIQNIIIQQDETIVSHATYHQMKEIYHTLATAKNIETMDKVVNELWTLMIKLENDYKKAMEKKKERRQKKLQEILKELQDIHKEEKQLLRDTVHVLSERIQVDKLKDEQESKEIDSSETTQNDPLRKDQVYGPGGRPERKTSTASYRTGNEESEAENIEEMYRIINKNTGTLKQRQQVLRKRLQELTSKIMKMHMKPGTLPKAEQEMQKATEKLESKNLKDAIDNEYEAIKYLEEMMKKVKKEAKPGEKKSDKNKKKKAEKGQRGKDEEHIDPLGRANPNKNLGVDPSAAENRSRAFRDKIRKRMEKDIPAYDKDYLKRILPENSPGP